MSTSAQPRRGPYAKTRGRIEAVGRHGYELVVEAGHRNLTLAEVARRAGLTESQVLYHFPSRDHLLVAALEHADARQEARRVERRADPAPRDEDPAVALAAVVNAELSDPRVLRLFVSMSAEATDPDHPAHAWALRRRAGIVEQYARFLRDLQERGWAHQDVDPERFARQLMALWDGLQTEWLVAPSFDLGAEVGAGLRALARRDAVLAREAVGALAHRL